MGPLLVVPADPAPDCPPGLREILKQMLPDALLLQAPEEAFDHAVLLGGVGGDELLAETVVSKRAMQAFSGARGPGATEYAGARDRTSPSPSGCGTRSCG